ncbi:MAG: hypothetical protein VX730_04540 [Pseudomonadota bacterium]|nr:hypothetical protein [Pseudomonadota bacterium]
MLSRLFFVFAILMGVSPTLLVHAQEMDPANHDVYDSSSGGYAPITPGKALNVNSAAKYGVLGNIGRPVTGGSSVAASDFQLDDTAIGGLLHGDANSARERTELMGCSAMDYHASAITSLNTNEDHVREYVDSPMGTFMLTTLLNSPAIASTFNSVEAFGAKRVQLMQDRCQAMQADATVSAEGMMRWQALQACVAENANLDTGGTVSSSGSMRSEDEAVSIAIAYRTCLYGSQGQDGTFSSDSVQAFGPGGADVAPSAATSLEGAMREHVLMFDGDEPSLWTGTLFHALRNTGFCIMEGGGAETAFTSATGDAQCALMAAIPNVRWCAGSQKYNRECLDDGKVRMSRATYTPQQVFDLIFAFSELELGYRDAYTRWLIEEVGTPLAEEIAIKGENIYNPMTGRPVDDAGVTQRVDEVKLFSGCISGGAIANDAEDFNEYIDRAINLDTTDDLDADTTVSFFGGTTLGALQSAPAVTPPDLYAVLSSGVLDDTGIAGQVSAKIGSDLVDDMYHTRMFAQMVVTATRCVMKHQTRLSLMDHIKLTELADEEKIGAMLAIRMNIAQTTTELMYRHIKEKLLFAQLDMQNGGSLSSRRATPPHVLASLDTLIKVIDNQLEYMESLSERQTGMSNLLSVLRRE